MKKGDRNTIFFHKVASHNKISNRILRLSINGSWSQNQEKIRWVVEEYYVDLYKEDHVSRPLLNGMDFDHISSDEGLCWISISQRKCGRLCPE